jgi:superfamily I DNA/RNA helicase
MRSTFFVTFTNKAAHEMKSIYVGSSEAKTWMGTFHSVLLEFLDQGQTS